jgi:hypothetical protein
MEQMIWCNDFSFSVCMCVCVCVCVCLHIQTYIYICIYDLGNLTCWMSLVCNSNQIFLAGLYSVNLFVVSGLQPLSGTPDRIQCLRNCVRFSAQGGKNVDTCFVLCYGDTYSNSFSSESSFQLLELKWIEIQGPDCILFGKLGVAQSPETKYSKCTVPLLQPYRIDILFYLLKLTVELMSF